MSSQANKEQFLKQFEQIVDGVEQNKAKVTEPRHDKTNKMSVRTA